MEDFQKTTIFEELRFELLLPIICTEKLEEVRESDV